MFPKRGSLWLLLGPAFVWAATAQGSGELIWWPYLVARYGGAFLALLLPAALLQFFVNREVSRYTAATGEGVWSGFWKMSRFYALPLFFLCFLSFLWFGGYASSGGGSLWSLLHWPFRENQKWGSLFWAYALVGIFSSALVFSKVAYRFIERVMKVVTVITLGGLLISVVLVGSLGDWRAFLGFLFNPLKLGQGVDWTGFDYSKLVTGIVFAGMGGFLNLMYSYWVKDKGVGAAFFSKKISGVLVKEKGEFEAEIIEIEDSEENRERWRKWEQYLNLDSGLAVVINALTIIMTSFLAFVLLWPRRQFPSGWEITLVQSRFFEVSFGALGKGLFLVVAGAFMVDTWLALADGVARQFADFSRAALGRRSMKWWYYLWLSFLIGVTLITMPLAQPDVLLVMVGVISVFAFVFYIPGLWYLNYRKVPREGAKWLRPGRVSGVLLWLVWALYAGLAGWYLWMVLIGRGS